MCYNDFNENFKIEKKVCENGIPSIAMDKLSVKEYEDPFKG